jgi:serine/threonine protein kinase
MQRVAPDDPLQGRMLGRYRLMQRLAQGGMATVYLARQEGPGGFDRPVAIKVVHSHLARERRFASMFLDEARLTGRLHHPNVCSVIEFGDQGGQLYLVMEYLHGETFQSALKRGWNGGRVLPPETVARILCDAARGLHAAHELTDAQGRPFELVHRDISPQNLIVLYDGHTKLTDFGIARARGRLTDTTVGELKGKISFMSPEQLQGGVIDRRTDIWALGVVAWEALSGRRLFRTENEGATAINVISAAIPPPSAIVRDVPEALGAIVMRALERDVDARTPTAAALADQLEEYLYSRGRPHGAREVSAWMGEHFADRLATRAAMLAAKPGDPVSQDAIEAIEPSGGSFHDPQGPVAQSEENEAKTTAFEPSTPPPGDEASAVRSTPLGSAPAEIHGSASSAARTSGRIPVTTAAATPVRRRRRTAIARVLGVVAVVCGVFSVALVIADDFVRRSAAERIAVTAIDAEATAAQPTAAQPTAAQPTAAQPTAAQPTASPTAAQPTTERASGPAPRTASPSASVSGPAAESRPDVAPPASGSDPAPGSGSGPAAASAADPATAPASGASSSPRPRLARAAPPRPARPRVAAAIAREPAGSGMLNLLAIPAAEVFVRGRSIGRTPLIQRELPAGDHVLELREIDGTRRERVQVEIRTGERTDRSVRFQ